jgi:hypothetical protein
MKVLSGSLPNDTITSVWVFGFRESCAVRRMELSARRGGIPGAACARMIVIESHAYESVRRPTTMSCPRRIYAPDRRNR